MELLGLTYIFSLLILIQLFESTFESQQSSRNGYEKMGSDCPVKCRCASQVQADLRWQYGQEDEPMRGRNKFPVRPDVANGVADRDMVCTGRNKVPRSFPEGMFILVHLGN